MSLAHSLTHPIILIINNNYIYFHIRFRIGRMNPETRETQFGPAPSDTTQVVLIRHAQSLWNQQNRFTGWADPPLTEAGMTEAIQAGQQLRVHGFRFDMAYSSRLQRAVTTLDILLRQIDRQDLPRKQDWRLNERHYGRLQGLDKALASLQSGAHQVWRWRRGYEDKSNPLPRTDPRHPANDPAYADVDPLQLPGVENLAQTRLRVKSFWNEQVVPHILRGERLLVSSHGNTLRALLMELADMSVAEVEGFEIPTATPIACNFDHNGRMLDWAYLNHAIEPGKKTA